MDDRPKNEEALEALIKLLKRNRAILFVGAGSSNRAGYPLWKELIVDLRKGMQADLGEELSNHDSEMEDPLWEAQRIRTFWPDHCHVALKAIFGPREPKDFHRRLIELPCHRFVTTNYDTLLEQASIGLSDKKCQPISWNDRDLLTDYIRHFHESPVPNEHKVFHLHGIFSHPEKIILTEKDYVKFYGEENPIKNLLWMMVASYSILFVGFSVSDWDFLSLFRVVRNRMVTEHPAHYAILPAEKLVDRATRRQYLNSKYGIQPIFYDIVPRKIKIEGKESPVDCYETKLDELMNTISDHLELPRYQSHVLSDVHFTVVSGRRSGVRSDEDLQKMERDAERFLSKRKES